MWSLGDVVAMCSVLVHEGTSVHMEPSDAPEAQTYVNGQLLSSPISLHHVCVCMYVCMYVCLFVCIVVI